jgi:wobble nucleotide-excising tRNase
MAAPIYRDEFEHRMEDLFVRSVEYTNSVMDVQRIKTARQVVQEIDATFGKWATGVVNEINSLKQEAVDMRRDISKLEQRQDGVEAQLRVVETLLRRIAQGLNIDLI